MNEIYVDLVLCKHEKVGKGFLFVAPPFTHLKRGDDVIVDTKKGKQPAIVIDSITTNIHSDDYMFIRKMNGMRELKKVLGKIVYLDYSEEEKDVTD